MEGAAAWKVPMGVGVRHGMEGAAVGCAGGRGRSAVGQAPWQARSGRQTHAAAAGTDRDCIRYQRHQARFPI